MNGKLEKLAWSAVKARHRLARGQAWISYAKDVSILFIGLYVLEDALKRFGIVLDEFLTGLMYFILPIAFFVFAYIIGYLDETKGIWKMEAVYGIRELNPFMEALDKKVDAALEGIKELKGD